MTVLRYLAFLWNPSVRGSGIAVSVRVKRLLNTTDRWTVCCDVAGLTVLCVGHKENQIFRLDGEGGVVVGDLFSGKDPLHAVAQRIDGTTSSNIVSSRGRQLIDAYWGRYVAFLNDARSNTKCVLRDPTGGLPCYRLQGAGFDIYCSWFEDCLRADSALLSINWEYIAARVVQSQIQGSATGFKEITELLQGECISISSSGSDRQLYWSPWKFATTNVVEDADAATDLVRHKFRHVVHTWASRHESVLLKLSGGLDSALVLSCLMTALKRPQVTCVNDYSAGPDTDERSYARAAAELADLKLIERQRDASEHIRVGGTVCNSPRPVSGLGRVAANPSNAELARQFGASAIFSGDGGDQVLYRSQGLWLGPDFAYRHGLDWRLLRTVLNASRMDPTSRGHTFWSLLHRSLRYGVLNRSQDLFEGSAEGHGRKLVTSKAEAALRSGQGWKHPWFSDYQGVAPGKVLQTFRLSFPQNYYDYAGLPDDPELVHPVFSQPLIELCLSIPTYVLAADRRDRALARRAFEAELPAAIARRRTKGGVAHYANELILQNMDTMREFLLDGLLVKHGLLDRTALEDSLGGCQTGLTTGALEILDHLNVEAWIQSSVRLTKPSAADHPTVRIA